MPEAESYRVVLHAHGLSVTRLRLAIMAVLPFADDSFDLAYCQQALQFFPDRPAALRELRRVLVPGGRTALYELTCDHSPPAHPHFTCRRCNRFICLEPVDLSSIWGLLTQGDGLVPETAEITLVGLCKECAAAGKAQDSK